jgi:hypothetical protein
MVYASLFELVREAQLPGKSGAVVTAAKLAGRMEKLDEAHMLTKQLCVVQVRTACPHEHALLMHTVGKRTGSVRSWFNNRPLSPHASLDWQSVSAVLPCERLQMPTALSI